MRKMAADGTLAAMSGCAAQGSLWRRLGRAARPPLLALLLVSTLPVVSSAFDSWTIRAVAAAPGDANASATNVATKENPAERPPARKPAKAKAGVLAAAGLVTLSLLVLAAGLALVRAFKQR